MSPWFLLAVMSLATFMLTRLVVDLDFPPVLWLRDRVVGGWRPMTASEHAAYRPDRANKLFKVIDGEDYRWIDRTPWVPLFFSDLISCPWCAGGWLALGITAGTWSTVGLPLPLLMWPATWALGSLLASRDWV